MIIENAAIHFTSRHHALTERRETESLQFRIGAKRNSARTNPSDSKNFAEPVTPTSTPVQETEMTTGNSLTALIVKRLVKDITGRDFVLYSPRPIQPEDYAAETPSGEPNAPADNGSGFGFVYQRISSYRETEQTDFVARGTISTTDGRSFSLATELSMQREFFAESGFTLRTGDADQIDPLVINFGDNATQLTDRRHGFDLDADGDRENIAGLTENSGLLALDKNGDGIINDGSELFGPTSGNGFTELAQHDADHNLYIDEADPIYRRLRIWLQQADGSQQLVSLAEKNIGAIYLGHIDTPFQLKTADNRSLGEISSTGIYLTEQGNAGTIQQINFTV